MASRWWHVLTVGIGVTVGLVTFGFGAPLAITLIAGGGTALAGSFVFEVVRNEQHVDKVETQNKARQKLIEKLEKKLEEMEAAGEAKDEKIAVLEQFKAETEAVLRGVRDATANLTNRVNAQQVAQVQIRAHIAQPAVANNPAIPPAARRPAHA